MVDRPPDPVDSRARLRAEEERARALAAVLRDQEDRAAATLEAEARRARRARVRTGVLAALWIGMAWLWLADPTWWRVDPPPAPPPAAEARALRAGMYLQAQRIEAYRRARGRLPDVLEDVGPPLPGMTYERRDSRSYDLRGTSPRIRVTYRSERPARALLDDGVLAGPSGAVGAPADGGGP